LPSGDLLVGSTATTPTGGKSANENAKLYILSWPDLKKGKEIDPQAGSDVRSLLSGPDGRVFGLTGTGDIFVFDSTTLGIVQRNSLGAFGSVADRGAPMFSGPGGD